MDAESLQGAPVPSSKSEDEKAYAVSVEDASDKVAQQIAMEDGHEIRYRSCSWQKVR